MAEDVDEDVDDEDLYWAPLQDGGGMPPETGQERPLLEEALRPSSASAWRWPPWVVNKPSSELEVYVLDEEDPSWVSATPLARVVNGAGEDTYLVAEYVWDGDRYVEEFAPGHVRQADSERTVAQVLAQAKPGQRILSMSGNRTQHFDEETLEAAQAQQELEDRQQPQELKQKEQAEKHDEQREEKQLDTHQQPQIQQPRQERNDKDHHKQQEEHDDQRHIQERQHEDHPQALHQTEQEQDHRLQRLPRTEQPCESRASKPSGTSASSSEPAGSSAQVSIVNHGGMYGQRGTNGFSSFGALSLSLQLPEVMPQSRLPSPPRSPMVVNPANAMPQLSPRVYGCQDRGQNDHTPREVMHGLNQWSDRDVLAMSQPYERNTHERRQSSFGRSFPEMSRPEERNMNERRQSFGRSFPEMGQPYERNINDRRQSYGRSPHEMSVSCGRNMYEGNQPHGRNMHERGQPYDHSAPYGRVPSAPVAVEGRCSLKDKLQRESSTPRGSFWPGLAPAMGVLDADALFNQLDTNKDGLLSRHEFVDGVLHRHRIRSQFGAVEVSCSQERPRSVAPEYAVARALAERRSGASLDKGALPPRSWRGYI